MPSWKLPAEPGTRGDKACRRAAALPASAEAAARLLGGETPYLLGRYENDAITALALSDGGELLLCAAGEPAFEEVCAALYGAKGLITRIPSCSTATAWQGSTRCPR